MTQKLNPKALGLAGAALSAILMFLMGILGDKVYTGAAEQMMQVHMFFDPSTTLGILGGIVEASVLSFVGLYAFALLYNKWA